MKHLSSNKESSTEQFLSVMLFVLLYSVVLTIDSVGETLKCVRSN